MPSVEYLIHKIIPDAIAFGSFGEGAKLVRIIEDPRRGKDQFASTIQFVDIEVDIGGDHKTFSTVCKLQCDSPEKRERFQTGLQFFNEVIVYKEIVPLLPESVKGRLPKFYYGTATLDRCAEEDVVIVENLVPSGYRQTSERLFLDYEHCSLVFRRLGEFHGASLIIKSQREFEFVNQVNRLAETRWIDKLKDDQNYYFGETAKRGVIPLIKAGEHLEILNRFLDKLVDVHGLMKDILDVNESNLLCHGDFCRNNMVFKYEDDRPVDVKFYDLATARHASPAIDISFFVFLNISPELRQRHIRDLLHIYREALVDVAGAAAPTAAELWNGFQKKAVYGYILIAFFLPVMVEPPSDEVQTMTLEQRVKLNLLRGGQQVTDILTQSVRDLISWGCLT